MKGNTVKICSHAAAYLAAISLVLYLPAEMAMQRTVYGQDASPMKIDILQYASMSASSSVYALTDNVMIEGSIPAEQIISESLLFFIDDNAVPFARTDKVDMILKDGKRAFSVLLDTSVYSEGTHVLSITDGDNLIIETDIYISRRPYAEITNVNISCNMRKSATTTSSTVISVPLAAEVDVLGSVKGQYRNEYNTDIWYMTKYTAPDGKVYEGYIISALVSVNSILDIKFSAEGMLFEKFSTMKDEYDLFVPENVGYFNINEVARLKQDDAISVTVNGSLYTGRLDSIALSSAKTVINIDCISSGGNRIIGYTFNIGRISAVSHNAFVTALGKFPESYRNQLMILHSIYPNWVFEPFETGLRWDHVINNQDVGTVSLIWKDIHSAYKKDDIIKDSSNFVTASRAAVEYYIDPRNFLNETNIFMFEKLSYDPDIHTLAGVSKIIAGTGLAGREQLFLDAGVDSNVSPYHLAARSRQEVTAWNPIGLSPIARGDYTFTMTREKKDDQGNVIVDTSGNPVLETYQDERYKGLYNFYNIGTGSSTDIGTLYRRGLNYARGFYTGPAPTYYGEDPNPKSTLYRMPWDSEAKAITGGAFFIGDSYINCGQDNLYLQKFDVDNDPRFGLFKHQYMQNVQAPLHESSATYKTYMQMDSLDNSFVFRIPVYVDMPENNIPLPEKAGLLDFVKVAGFTISPAFDPIVFSGYEVTVPSEHETVDIYAGGNDSRSQITGTGKVALDYGENLIKLTCISPNSSPVEYSITITRSLPEKSADNYLRSLSLMNASFDRAFGIYDLGVYKAEVAYSVTKTEIVAEARSESAVIIGSGKFDLSPGINDFVLTVTSENGKSREYKVSVHRVIPKITSSMLKLSDGKITGLDLSSTAGILKTSLQMTAGSIEVIDINGKAIGNNSYIGTGSKVRLIYDNNVIEEHIVVIFGDLNGDGQIDSTDITLLRSGILRLRKFEGEFYTAGDINKDGLMDSTDLTHIRRHILRLKEINQAD